MTRRGMADAPDGGWGWVIVAAVTIINLAVLPIQQCFGLIFEEEFSKWGITATQTSVIVHLNSTIMCSLGLISGPMMRKFSFRTVAYFGSLAIVTGTCLTAFANSLTAIIVTYCIVIGIGQGIMYPATGLALNTYFQAKRSIAMGVTVTLTGLGPILMPQLIAKLLGKYATMGTVLILGGVAMHSFIGAALLRPLKSDQVLDIGGNDSSSTSRDTNHNKDDKAIEMEVRTTGTVSSDSIPEGSNSISNRQVDIKDSFVTSDGTAINTDGIAYSETNEPKLETNRGDQNKILEEEVFLQKPISDVKGKWRMRFSKTATSLDLSLLRDNRFRIIVIGMALSFVSELNFNLMTPFVLAELAGLERADIATVMSVQAAADIIGRLCVPLLAQRNGWTSRNLYIASLLGSTAGRTILSVWSNSYGVVVGLTLILGVAKGTKAVFQALVIPDSVPLARLPAASGLLMVCNGVLSIALGPLIGLVHDVTDSYVLALHLTSALSLTCVFLWIGERILTSKKQMHSEIN